MNLMLSCYGASFDSGFGIGVYVCLVLGIEPRTLTFGFCMYVCICACVCMHECINACMYILIGKVLLIC